ncbi:unnamed protein product [Peronospora belbahrii]|uniref:Mitotic checkpoint protein BUB3 n=1 Tax=Peronospora belbahrii TaxID=622444 RepID=A0ABN8CZN2_9STRA|nr:unnamed protein product [Peronospora belbahrii]
MTEVELQAPPSDGVSCLRFGTQSHLLVASWDAMLRVYDGARLRTSIEMETPVLSCCYGKNDAEAFAGGLDCIVNQIDVTTRQKTALGTHDAAVRHVGYSREFGLAVSGGWDGMIKVFDVRNGANAKIHEAKVPGKVFGMDARSHLVATGTSERQVAVFDLRQLTQPLVQKESPLKYQMRCVSIFPDLTGIALASVEGRVALEYFEDDMVTTTAESSKKKRSYAFKCHRGKMDGQTLIYPVNSISFHPTYGTFATGGCDGVVNFWDGANKKRITHLRQYPTSVSALDFNHDGSILAIAASYTYEQGEKDHPNDAIFLHTVQDSEKELKEKKVVRYQRLTSSSPSAIAHSLRRAQARHAKEQCLISAFGMYIFKLRDQAAFCSTFFGSSRLVSFVSAPRFKELDPFVIEWTLPSPLVPMQNWYMLRSLLHVILEALVVENLQRLLLLPVTSLRLEVGISVVL